MSRRTWKYWLYRTARILAISYGTTMLFACVIANRMIFMPPAPSYAPTEEGVVQFGAEREFAGFYFPPPRPGAPTLLWAHGNGEDAGQVRHLAHAFHAEGLGVMVYDYPGYGLSPGPPSEEGTFRCAEAAYDFLTKEQNLEPKDIVLFGQSVGSGPSSWLAEKKEVAGMVLISPFKSTFRVVTRVKILPWDRFDNWKRIQSVEIPLLVIHGDVDKVVPFSHGKALYQRYRGEKEFVRLEGIGHNDLWSRSSEVVLEATIAFVQRVTSEGPAS